MPMTENLLSRVRALLAKAESTEFEHEAEAFNQKAAELIARHGIDEALLAASGAKADTVGQLRIDIDNPYSMEKATLLTVVSLSMRCQSIGYTSGRTVNYCIVVGFGSDLERVNLIYTSLLMQAASQVTRQKSTHRAYSTVSYRKSWFAGFNAAVQTRLRETERKAAEQSQSNGAPSTALVLRDRSRAVSEVFADSFPNATTRNARSTDRWSDGYANGRSAGERADLGATRLGRRNRAINA